MAPWNSSPHVDVQIQYDGEYSSPTGPGPMFIGNEYITGAANFSLRKNYEGMRYKIAIKGVVQIKTTELPTGGLQSTLTVETQTFLSATLFEGSEPAVMGDHARYIARVPFKFNLGNNNDNRDSFSNCSRSTGHTFQDFLPSIDSKTAGRHWSSTFKSGPDAQYSVVYKIIATAVSEKKKVCSASRNFTYYPSNLGASPVALEDYPEEFTVRTNKAVKDSPSISRIGLISQEPPLLTVRRNSSSGETDLHLFLMLFRDGAASFGKGSLPRQAHSKAELRTTTIALDRAGTPAAHTLPGAVRTGAVIKQYKSHAQEYTISLNQWHCPDSESEEDHTTSTSEEVLTNALTIPFKISGKRMPPPAFHSPLLSRRYAIDLALTFDNDSSTAMKLRLPVQIGYDT